MPSRGRSRRRLSAAAAWSAAPAAPQPKQASDAVRLPSNRWQEQYHPNGMTSHDVTPGRRRRHCWWNPRNGRQGRRCAARPAVSVGTDDSGGSFRSGLAGFSVPLADAQADRVTHAGSPYYDDARYGVRDTICRCVSGAPTQTCGRPHPDSGPAGSSLSGVPPARLQRHCGHRSSIHCHMHAAMQIVSIIDVGI